MAQFTPNLSGSSEPNKKGRRYIPDFHLLAKEERLKLKDFMKVVKEKGSTTEPLTITSKGIETLKKLKNNERVEDFNREIAYVLVTIFKAQKENKEPNLESTGIANIVPIYKFLSEGGYIEGDLGKLFEGGYRLIVTPSLLLALDESSRGRTSRETEKKKSALALYVGEHIPSAIRSLIKKSATGQKIQKIEGKYWIPTLLNVGIDNKGDLWVYSPFKYGQLTQFESNNV